MDSIVSGPLPLLMVTVTAAMMYLALIVMTRHAGVRSFSKMSGFDFALIASIGSVFASVIPMQVAPVARGLMALALPCLALPCLALPFALQIGVAMLRVCSDRFVGSTRNKPRLIMANGRILRNQMVKTRITEKNLMGKLRKATVLDFSQVDAAVAETKDESLSSIIRAATHFFLPVCWKVSSAPSNTSPNRSEPDPADISRETGLDCQK